MGFIKFLAYKILISSRCQWGEWNGGHGLNKRILLSTLSWVLRVTGGLSLWLLGIIDVIRVLDSLSGSTWVLNLED